MNEIRHIQKTLTPIILEKGMSGYDIVQDIEEKLNDPEVFNIAITGPYGSGKSTVLKSLKTIYPNNHTYVTISLASLTGKRENEKELKGEEQQKVEYSILQQLIYKEKPETLPNSRFRRIEQRTKKKAIGYGIATLAFIVAFLIVFEPQWARVDTLYEMFNLGHVWNLAFDICFSLYMLFFVLSGANLDLTIFISDKVAILLIISLIYVVFRAAGKYTGSYFSMGITRCEPQVKKYFGFTLIPQAGVAIGLATTANKLFNDAGAYEAASLVLAVVLTSTLVYELTGPLIAKFALKKAGEIPEETIPVKQ